MAQDRKIRIDLNITRNDGRKAILTLETGKQYYGVGSEAQVGWLDDQGFMQIALGIGGGGDYFRKVAKVAGAATQKRIDTLHAETFTPEMVAEITEQAKAWSQRSADREAEQAQQRAARDRDRISLTDADFEHYESGTIRAGIKWFNTQDGPQCPGECYQFETLQDLLDNARAFQNDPSIVSFSLLTHSGQYVNLRTVYEWKRLAVAA